METVRSMEQLHHQLLGYRTISTGHRFLSMTGGRCAVIFSGSAFRSAGSEGISISM